MFESFLIGIAIIGVLFIFGKIPDDAIVTSIFLSVALLTMLVGVWHWSFGGLVGVIGFLITCAGGWNLWFTGNEAGWW